MPVKTYPIQPQYDDALTEADMLRAQGIEVPEAEMPIQQTYQQYMPSAQDMQSMALQEQYAQQQQRALLEQQAAADQYQQNIANMQNQELQTDLSPLLALADAWGTDKSNLAGNYRRPMTAAEKNAQIMSLQEKLAAQKDKIADNKTKALGSALAAYKMGKVDPTKQRYMEAQIRALDSMSGIRAEKAGEVKDTQATAAGYGKRVEQAEQVFDRLAQKGYDRANLGESLQATLLPHELQSENLRMQEQAERNFVNAVLRRESGAVISDQEFENARQQYLPRPGDTPDILAQKKANRMQVLESLKLGAGSKAWGKLPLVQPGQTGGGSGLTPEEKMRKMELIKKLGIGE